MTDQELKDLFRDRVGDVSYVELYSDENGKVRQMWYLVYLVVKFKSWLESTGKSLSEALFLDQLTHNMTNDCSLIYQFSTWKLQAQNMGRTCCVQKLFWMSNQKQKTICVHNMSSQCSELVVFMYWIGISMSNRLSYCGLVDFRKNASDKDLPVLKVRFWLTVTKTVWVRHRFIRLGAHFMACSWINFIALIIWMHNMEN